MSRDPLDGNEFDPKTLHKYLYANGDPINGLDPTGRVDAFEAAKILQVVLVAATAFTIVDFGYCLYKEVTALGSALSLQSSPSGNYALDILQCMEKFLMNIIKPAWWPF